MTTLNLAPTPPPQVTGLVSAPAIAGVILSWNDLGAQVAVYEVWSSTSGSFDDATLLASVVNNHYTATGNTTAYFWVRAFNIYGAYGSFSDNTATDYLTGTVFNTCYITLWANTSSSTTSVAIQNVQACAYWITSLGVAANSGMVSFTTTITQGPFGDVWVNPDYARVDDSNSATCSSVDTGGTTGMYFYLNDLGMPSSATLVGLQVQVKGQTANASLLNVNMYIGNGVEYGYVPAGGFHFHTFAFTANSTNETHTVGSSSDYWFLKSGAVSGTPGLITREACAQSVTFAQAPATPTTSLPTVSSYGTWYSCAYSTFNPNPSDAVNLSGYLAYTLSSVTCTSGQVLKVWARTRLYDNFASVYVIGAVKTYLLYVNNAGTAWGNLIDLKNFTDQFITTFSGLLYANHTYDWHIEIMIQQVTGAPTATLTVNDSAVVTGDITNIS
jgi:hypothetical protein